MSDKYNTQYDGINKFIKSVIGMKQQNHNKYRKKKRRKRYQFKKGFVKTIERRTIRQIILLSKKDAVEFYSSVMPLNNTDKLFLSSNNFYDSLLNRGIYLNEVHFPEAYFNTAILLLTMIQLTNTNSIRDGLIYPALFCFRHYLELIMKDTLNYYNGYSKVVAEDVAHREHRLYQLWNSLSAYIEEGMEKKIMERLISELHNIDPKGELFRYPYELSEDDCKLLPNIALSGLLEVENLKNVMLKMYQFMDGINSLAYERERRKK